MIDHNLSLLRGDINRLQSHVYTIKANVLPLLIKIYKENQKTLIDLNIIKLSDTLFERVETLSYQIDAFNDQLHAMKAPTVRGHSGANQMRYHQQQQFHGIRGELNDKLQRLKKYINNLLREMKPYRVRLRSKSQSELQHETFEMADVVDYQALKNHDFVEYVDLFNATIMLATIIIKALKKKK